MLRFLSFTVYMCGVCLKASELVAVKSKADELLSQKAALDDHIATLKVTLMYLLCSVRPDSVMVKAFDSLLRGRGFNSCHSTFR